MNSLFDLRKHNIKDENDAIDFLDLIINKAPQLQKILKANRLKQQSLISRAEFAEGHKTEIAAANQSPNEASVGDRITGRVTPETQPVEQSRLEQMRSASPVQTLDISPEVSESDDPLGLTPAGPASPGSIGRLNLAATQPHELPPAGTVAPVPEPPIPAQPVGPVDLAAIAASAAEEAIAATAGTSPSEHATNDDTQQQDQGPDIPESHPPIKPYEVKEGDQVYSQFQDGEDIFQHIIGEGGVDHYLKNGFQISVQDYQDVAKYPADTNVSAKKIEITGDDVPQSVSINRLAPDDTTGVGDRVAREQNNTQG